MNTDADPGGSLWDQLGIALEETEPMPGSLWDAMVATAVDPATPAVDTDDDLVPFMDDAVQSFPDDTGGLLPSDDPTYRSTADETDVDDLQSLGDNHGADHGHDEFGHDSPHLDPGGIDFSGDSAPEEHGY